MKKTITFDKTDLENIGKIRQREKFDNDSDAVSWALFNLIQDYEGADSMEEGKPLNIVMNGEKII